MSENHTEDRQRIRQIDHAIETKKPSGDPLLDELTDLTPQANEHFQGALEKRLLEHFEQEQGERMNQMTNSIAKKMPRRTSRLPLTLAAAVLAVIVIGGALVAINNATPPNDPFAQGGEGFELTVTQLVQDATVTAFAVGLDCVYEGESFIYVVQEGDTLSRISDTFEVSVDEIVQANCLDDAQVITVGQPLRIPGEMTELPTVIADPFEQTATALIQQATQNVAVPLTEDALSAAGVPIAQANRDLEVRAAPSAEAEPIATMPSGEALEMRALSDDGQWVRVLLPTGAQGWIPLSPVFVTVIGDLNTLEVTQPTLTATFTPTATHTPTLTHTPTATHTPTLTHTPTVTPSRTFTPTPTVAPSSTPLPGGTSTFTPTPADSASVPGQIPNPVQVVRVVEDVPELTEITYSMLEVASVSRDDVGERVVFASPEQVVGRVALGDLEAGAIIFSEDVSTNSTTSFMDELMNDYLLVLVAVEDIPLGTIITEEMVMQSYWPRSLFAEPFTGKLSMIEQVVGQQAQTFISAYSPLTEDELGEAVECPQESPGCVVLSANQVAVAFPVANVPATAFAPGQQVDVIVPLAFVETDAPEDTQPSLVIQRVFDGVTVLFIGGFGDGETLTDILTVEVSPQDAQVLTFLVESEVPLIVVPHLPNVNYEPIAIDLGNVFTQAEIRLRP